MGITWHDSALDDFRSAVHTIAKRFSPSRAIKFRAEVNDLTGRLANFPHLGKCEPLLEDVLDGRIRSIPVDRLNKLVYIEADDNTLVIIALWNTRRNPDTLIAETSGRTRR